MHTRTLHLTVALCLCLAINASAIVHYVDLNSAAPTPPYTNWATAATNIQDAVDASTNGDLILVTNGVYQTGGRVIYGTLTNRVAVTRPVTLQSVNGPGVTLIRGYQPPGGSTNDHLAVRCVYLTNNALLSGFTLTNGAALRSTNNTNDAHGGGAWSETNGMISNCVIVSNRASNFGGGGYQGIYTDCTIVQNRGDFGAGVALGTLNRCTVQSNSNPFFDGGGVYSSVLNKCSLIGNICGEYGGGAYNSTLNYCTLSNNVAGGSYGSAGGGAYNSILHNCTVISNSAQYYGGGVFSGTLDNCALIGNSCAVYGGGARYGTLSNCTLINNTSENLGGGADSVTLIHCMLSGNSAGHGGGMSFGTFDGCTLIGNVAVTAGGGAYYSTLTNCTAAGNAAPLGSLYGCTANNSIVYYSDSNGPNYDVGTVLNYCCTTPLPTNGSGNITNVPLFVDQLNGDLRLQPNSPCINAGNNAFAPTGPDLDGNPRIAGGTVDIGAYEFQSPTSLLSYAWAQQFGLPTDGSADFLDPDHDGMNNWQEWRAGTDPTNATSALRMVAAAASTNATGLDVTWQSVSGINYFLDRSSDLGTPFPFQTIATNITGQAGTTTFTDSDATNSGPYFYRVGVQ